MADRITALTIVHEVLPTLLEWVAHLDLVGVDRIVAFTHPVRDRSDALLDRLAQIGAPVIRRDAPGPPIETLAHAAASRDLAVLESDWVLVLATDELLHVKTGAGRIADLIAATPGDTTGIALTSRIMGSNGRITWRPEPLLPSFTRGAPDDFRHGRHLRSLFRPVPGARIGAHHPALPDAEAGRAAWVDGSGTPLPIAALSAAARPAYGLGEIARFAVQSHEAYLLRQWRETGRRPTEEAIARFGLLDRNEIAVEGLAAWAPAVAERVAEYLRDPILAALHAEGLAWHAGQMATLRDAPGHAEDLDRLRRAASVAYADLETLAPDPPAPERPVTDP